MQIINSNNNKRIKEFKKLKDKKYRKIKNLFLLEGKKFCLEALKSDFKIVYTLCADSEEMITFVQLHNFENIIAMPQSLIDSISETVSSQGIICICEIKENKFIGSETNSLVLDNVQDGGNLGTLIRSAAAFDFKNVYLINCVDPYNEKVIRATAGNFFKVNIIQTDYGQIKDHKIYICDKLVAAACDGVEISKIQFKNERIAVVIGNEGNGISDEMLKLCDMRVKIEMAGNVESLNASVAGSIIMHKIFGGN